MIVVLHGILRNADEYRDHAVVLAERFDAPIVAPKFDAERFPTHRYQRGGLLTEKGELAPRAEWSFAMIPEVARAVREREGLPQLPYWIIGHSAGGQIAMRMCAFVDTGHGRHCTNPEAGAPALLRRAVSVDHDPRTTDEEGSVTGPRTSGRPRPFTVPLRDFGVPEPETRPRISRISRGRASTNRVVARKWQAAQSADRRLLIAYPASVSAE